jgi:hypothetical protein
MRTVRFIEAVVAILAAWLVAACTKHPSRFCCTSEESCAQFSGQPITLCTDPARPYCDEAGEYGPRHACISDPTGCSASADCPAPQVCDVGGTNTCVACTAQEDAACTGATPVCGNDKTCRGCRAHAECARSDACLPDGSCADPDADQVAYVQQGGTGTPPCARGAPCGTLQQGVDAGRPYIKIATGTVVGTDVTTIDGKAVTILADPGAKLDRMGDGRILLVRSAGANVSIYDLEITGQTGPADEAIQLEPNGGMPALSLVRVKVTGNQGRAISSSGNLTVSQTTIFGNAGGGIAISGVGATFNITNNLIFRNGNSTTATVGGVALTASVGANVFAFNTVVDNQVQNGALIAGGVLCDIAGFAAANNIIVRNFVNNNPNLANSNTSGLCTYPTSTISPAVSGLNFVSPDDAPYDYHLMRGSTAIDQATTSSNLSVDIDGDIRPQGNARDQGADEVSE